MVVVVAGSIGRVVMVVVVVLGSTGTVVMVVVVLGSTTAVVVVVVDAVVVVVVVVVVVAMSGAGGMISAGAVGGTGATGKRSAKVVGRQAAWAGATAMTDTKVTQAKKSVVTRILKVLSGYPIKGKPEGAVLLVTASTLGLRTVTEATTLPPPGSRRNPSGQ